MDFKTDDPRNKGELSQNHNFYKKINLADLSARLQNSRHGLVSIVTSEIV